jgi:N-carbamoyl-L-amino-acid hydrolase
VVALSRFGRNADGGIDRVAYSEADLEARAWVMAQMREAGLAVRIDTAGNIIGRREGRESGLPPLMTGSHIDSVPGGGNYDGQVGSMAAIECAHAIGEGNGALRHPLEVIIFQNEENGKVGSKAIRGQDPATYLDLPTHSGKTIREGIRFIGGDPDRVGEAVRRPGEIAAFLELHIEQGAVLEAARMPIGIVQGIVGIRRWAITIAGFANHAGTTPMDQRRDALLAAARFIDAVHRIVRSVPGRQVATVGTIEVEPGAPNVIPGAAALTLEMRDLDLDKVERIFNEIRAASGAIGDETGTAFDFSQIYRTEPADTDAAMRETIAGVSRELGLATMDLPSGAGHDAQEIAPLAPIGMIFIPSAGGISHSPREFSTPADIENGANVLLNTLVRVDADG